MTPLIVKAVYNRLDLKRDSAPQETLPSCTMTEFTDGSLRLASEQVEVGWWQAGDYTLTLLATDKWMIEASGDVYRLAKDCGCSGPK